MFHGDVFGDWREESILVNYETNELVIFTTDIASDYKFYTHMQNPCYRNGTTTKGYVQASMLDYYLGWDMDTPKKPDIEIIGGEREPSFANVTEPESSSSVTESSSSVTKDESSSSVTENEPSSSASEPTEEPAESSSSDENESSSSSEVTQVFSQNITGVATKFSAQIFGNRIILNNAPSGLYTISIFDMQGNQIQKLNVIGNEADVLLKRGAYVARISQNGRVLGMFRAVKR